jgi:hypothetical protein
LELQEALKTFEKWPEASRINFLEQVTYYFGMLKLLFKFVDMYDLFDERFHELVQQFCVSL